MAVKRTVDALSSSAIRSILPLQQSTRIALHFLTPSPYRELFYYECEGIRPKIRQASRLPYISHQPIHIDFFSEAKQHFGFLENPKRRRFSDSSSDRSERFYGLRVCVSSSRPSLALDSFNKA
jgi:hypothetical protein